jgi:hypothetical protein
VSRLTCPSSVKYIVYHRLIYCCRVSQQSSSTKTQRSFVKASPERTERSTLNRCTSYLHPPIGKSFSLALSDCMLSCRHAIGSSCVCFNCDCLSWHMLMAMWCGAWDCLHLVQAIDYGTQIVGGVNPKKGGTVHLGVPIFKSVAQAVNETGKSLSMDSRLWLKFTFEFQGGKAWCRTIGAGTGTGSQGGNLADVRQVTSHSSCIRCDVNFRMDCEI